MNGLYRSGRSLVVEGKMPHLEKMNFGLPEKWDEVTDVAVIGSGFAGLAAAIRAREAGAEVIIAEKMLYAGGNSVISGGGCCSYDSKLHLRQKLGLGEDSWQLHKEDTIRGGGNKSEPELVEIMTRCAPEAIDLFVDAGVVFAETQLRMGGHSAFRGYMTIGSKGAAMYRPMRDMAVNKGAELRLKTAVKRIWRADGSSPVAGLELEQEGKTIQLQVRKAVIMASGGFSRDVDFRIQFNPKLTDVYNCDNHKGATGECIRFASGIGADVMHMNYIQLFPTANPKTGFLDKPALYAYSSTGFGSINVDKTGRRFVNEQGGRDEVSDAQILGVKEKPTYTILNQAIFDASKVPAADIEAGIRNGRITAAETIPELAEKLQMPELPAAVGRHNGYLAEGEDPEYHKCISSHMIPLDSGPYYAIAQWPTIHFCMGGLKFDKTAHVLDTNGIPIPRFYAAGECCGGIHGTNRLGGNAITEAMVFGSIAGRAAAAEEPMT